jgi:hypothetical protein
MLDALERLVVAPTLRELTFILDLAPADGLARARAEAAYAGSRGRCRSFERRDPQFHERLRAGYLAIAEAEPQRCVLVDGASAPDAIAAEIWATSSAALLQARPDGPRTRTQEDEALPEADRLEGFLHPRETRTLSATRRELELAQPLPAAACIMPGCSRDRRGSARRRWPTGWRGTCWRARGARSRGQASRLRQRRRRAQVRALSHPGLLVLRRPYDVAPSGLRRASPWTRSPAQVVLWVDGGGRHLARGDRRCRR